MITAQLNGQELSVQYTQTVSESVKYLTVSFTFDSDWDGYVKTALFAGADGVTHSVVMLPGNGLYPSENVCIVPHEAITYPSMRITVNGFDGDKIITSSVVTVPVSRGLTDTDKTAEPSEDVWQQLLSTTAHAETVAQSVRDDADSGLFKGEKGDKGDKGDTGAKGDKGDKGEKGDTPLTDQTYSAVSENAQSGKAVAQALSEAKSYTDTKIGSVDTVLDSIIALQNSYIGGESV